MKGLAICLHIGIRDLQSIFERLGHQLDVWSLSDHHHLMGWPRAKVDIVNQYTWRNLDQKMCDDFYERYKDEFKQYDFFVCFYPPAFSMLYEKFEKPIIVYVPIRYEVPFFSKDKWTNFNTYLQNGIDKKQIIPLVNNLYDQNYLQYFTKRNWQLIPSLCDYTNTKYTGVDNRILLNAKSDIFKIYLNIPNLVDKKSIENLSWQNVCDFKCLVYIPYSNTLMSLFEQYTSNIPLLLPSKKFLTELWTNYSGNVMSEISWNYINNMYPNSSIYQREIPDPNDYNSLKSFEHWSAFSDFYDTERMPYIEYFDSWQELKDKFYMLDFEEISNNMKYFNIDRKENIFNSWQKVLSGL